MGIKNFSKVFNKRIEINEQYYTNKILAIDAMNILYKWEKAAVVLTGVDGDFTHSLNILLYTIIRRRKNGNKEIWCFDYRDTNNNTLDNTSLKYEELIMRKDKKSKVTNEIDIIKQSLNCTDITDIDKIVLEKKLFKKNKEIVGVSNKRILEAKFILKNLNIAYIDCPKNVEAEQMCAILLQHKIVDYIITDDYDALLFGASNIVKNYTNRKTKEKKYIYIH